MYKNRNSQDSSNKLPEPAIFSETHSLVFQEKISSGNIQQALTLWIEEIRDWALGYGFLVGHIKIYVEGQENLWLSSTGNSINMKHSRGWEDWFTDKVTLSVTAIIFETSKETLSEVAQLRLQTCLDSLKLK